ncbi:MAG: hypothetical protein ACI9QL_005019, partial [Candidatus Omnitrophota bacterium]
ASQAVVFVQTRVERPAKEEGQRSGAGQIS